MKSTYICYFDGACEPHNPGGDMGIGACIMSEHGEQLHTHSLFVPAHKNNSNNVAEYSAFLWIVEKLIEIINTGKPVVKIHGDSKLVIMQMKGHWKMKGGMYMKTATKAQEQLKQLHLIADVSLNWIPREQNGYADELSKAPMIYHNTQFRIQPNK